MHQMQMGNDAIEFSARFGGVAHSIFVPIHAVLAIYASENGQGMGFADEGVHIPADQNAREDTQTSGVEQERPNISVHKSSENDNGDDPDPPTDTPPRPRKKPTLKVVK